MLFSESFTNVTVATINEIIIIYYYYLDADNGVAQPRHARHTSDAYGALTQFGKSSFLFDLTARKISFPLERNPRQDDQADLNLTRKR